MSNANENIKVKVRECPHCHRKVSLTKCSTYFVKGTDKSVQCNHCHREIIPKEDPLNFNACVYAGFFSAFVIVLLCVFLFKLDFPYAMLVGILGVMIEEIVCMVLILRRIKFKKMDEGKNERNNNPLTHIEHYDTLSSVKSGG